MIREKKSSIIFFEQKLITLLLQMKSKPNFERRNRNRCALQLINVECYNFLFNEVIDSLLGGTFQKRPFF